MAHNLLDPNIVRSCTQYFLQKILDVKIVFKQKLLTKFFFWPKNLLCGPRIFWTNIFYWKFFLTQNFFEPNLFGPKFLTQNFFRPKIISGPTFFLIQKFVWPQNFFQTQNFFPTQKFVQTQNFFKPKFFCGPKFFSRPKFLSDPNNFWTHFYFQTQNDVWREKTKLLNFKLSNNWQRAKVLLKVEFDTEDQVLFVLFSFFRNSVMTVALSVALLSQAGENSLNVM